LSELTIRDYQKEVDRWVKTVGVRYFSELTNMGILMEEVGEVARIMTRVTVTRASREKAKCLSWRMSLPILCL